MRYGIVTNAGKTSVVLSQNMRWLAELVSLGHRNNEVGMAAANKYWVAPVKREPDFTVTTDPMMIGHRRKRVALVKGDRGGDGQNEKKKTGTPGGVSPVNISNIVDGVCAALAAKMKEVLKAEVPGGSGTLNVSGADNDAYAMDDGVCAAEDGYSGVAFVSPL